MYIFDLEVMITCTHNKLLEFQCRLDRHSIVASGSVRVSKSFHLLISMGNMSSLCNKVDKGCALVNSQKNYRECNLLVQNSHKKRLRGEH